MGDSDDARESDTRRSRIEALRGLTQDEHAGATLAATESPTDMPNLAPVPRTSIQRGSSMRAFWQRWGSFSLVIVAAVVIFGLVAGAILKNTSSPFSPKPPPALTVSKVISLQTAGTLACPSTPVWSPDGKQVAVVALVGATSNSCYSAPQIQQADGSIINSGTSSGSQSSGFAVAIFDTTTGHAIHTIKLPELTMSLLCAGANPCVANGLSDQVYVQTPALQSIGWSPDGRTIGVFFTYFFNYGDFIHYENRGALIVVPVTGSGAPRAFIAKARVVGFADGAVDVNKTYSPPRFTWDLTTGAGSYTDIHQGEYPWTAPFSESYLLDDTGALTLAHQWRTGDASPWNAGVFNMVGPQGASQPTVSYQSSQWLWSADSRYVSPNLNVSAYLVLPGVTVAPPPDTIGSVITAPNLTPPDAATTQAVKAAVSAHVGAALARNPSHTLLADYLCAPNGDGQLTIRSGAAGKMLAQTNYSYPLTSTSLGCKGDIGSILWSPDGAHIASVDGPDGQIILWQVNLHA